MTALAMSMARLGDAMQRRADLIRAVQWGVIALYAVLVTVPALLPLPPDEARILDHLTLFAQFVFWGIWWPFVLLSMVLFGRVWCGVFCPEGALSEAVSHVGLGRGIPRWLRWPGWPLLAFVLTTVYGQMVSVYEYPKAVLLVLGGSTVAAVVIGWLYGRGKRVWCRHLCPVSGVFNLLARLAPVYFRVDPQQWQAGSARRNSLPNCAPLIDIRRMQGAAACHACGRCSGHRSAVRLASRSPATEIVVLGREAANAWDARLLCFGLIGVAMGAFHWNASPWFIVLKQMLAEWLIDRDWLWPLEANAPWWLLTHYPERNDTFTWLDGGLVVAHILGTGLAVGAALTFAAALAARLLGRPGARHHLALAFIPLGGCGVFLGLSMTTLTLLHAEGLRLAWVPAARALLLAGAALWTLWLGWRIGGEYRAPASRRMAAFVALAGGVALVVWGWALLFFIW